VVILVFNCAQALADATLSSHPVDGRVVGVVVAQLAISACGGVLLGGALVLVVFWRGRSCARRKNRRAAALQQGLKKVLLLACAALIFIASHVAHPWVEPLLACLVAGFVVTNHTRYVRPLAARDDQCLLRLLLHHSLHFTSPLLFSFVSHTLLVLDLFVATNAPPGMATSSARCCTGAWARACTCSSSR